MEDCDHSGVYFVNCGVVQEEMGPKTVVDIEECKCIFVHMVNNAKTANIERGGDTVLLGIVQVPAYRQDE